MSIVRAVTDVVCVISGSIVTSFDAASSSDSTLEGMLDAIASDVKDQKTISFDGNNYQFEKSMLVDNKPYNNVVDAVSDIDVETPALLKTVVVLSTVYGQDNILSCLEVRSSSENVKRLGQSCSFVAMSLAVISCQCIVLTV